MRVKKSVISSGAFRVQRSNFKLMSGASSLQHLQIELAAARVHPEDVSLLPPIRLGQHMNFAEQALCLDAKLGKKERVDPERKFIARLACRAGQIDQEIRPGIKLSQMPAQFFNESLR